MMTVIFNEMHLLLLVSLSGSLVYQVTDTEDGFFNLFYAASFG